MLATCLASLARHLFRRELNSQQTVRKLSHWSHHHGLSGHKLVTSWSHMPPIFLNSLFFGNILLVIMMYSLTGQESWQSIWTKSVPNILGHKYCLETQRNQEESSPFRILLDFSIENFQQQQKSCPVGRFANFADLTFSLCSILSKQCSIDRQHCRTSLFTNIKRECLSCQL